MNSVFCLSFIIFMMIALTGCSSAPKQIPHQHNLSETTGAGSKRFGITATQAYKIRLAENLATDPIVKDPAVKKTSNIAFFGSGGITDTWDYDYSFGPDVPLRIGMGFQFFGGPSNSAGGGNFSLSARFSAGMSIVSGEIPATEVVTTAPTKSTREFLMSSYVTSFSLLAGYRIFQPLLVYFSWSKESFGHFIDFTKGIDEELEADGNLDTLTLGVDYKLGIMFANFYTSKTTFSLDQDSEEDDDGLLFALNFGVQI